MISPQKPFQKERYTPEEYLALEEKADYKSDYDDGMITPMMGGTTDHKQIAGNCYIALTFGFEKTEF